MSSDISDSIVLITGRDSDRSRNFGTGFAIAQDDKTIYLLTCAHVVRDVGGREQVLADGIPATVIAAGDEVGFDLAVLRVEGLWDKPRLSLCLSGEVEKPLIIAGFYQFDPKTPPALRTIRGSLGEQIRLSSRDGSDRVKAWDLKIEGEYYLQPGYSGSPVIDRENGCVLGVVTHQIGKGEKGLAISIQALVKIWQEMPASLITPPSLPQLSFNPASVIFISPNSTVTNVVGSGQINYQEAPNTIRDLTINVSREAEAVSSPHLSNQQRQQSLQKSLKEALELLEEYEQQEMLDDDPNTRRYAQIKQERLRRQIEKYQQEIQRLGY